METKALQFMHEVHVDKSSSVNYWFLLTVDLSVCSLSELILLSLG